MDDLDPLPADPVDQSAWRELRLLQAVMDADIGRLYAERNIDGLRPSHTMALIRLNHRGPMTITELADSVQGTHSAMSQKVAALRRAGLVRSAAGSDARTKRISLTAKAKRIVGFLEAEWRATENAVAGIEAEIPYPLSQVVDDITEALQRKSFHDRVVDGLAAHNSWH
ncbi:MAG: MarR family winged helix-turn-helix transcriptional regulator [Nakamurella sp.]